MRQKKSVAEYHLTFSVQIPKIRYFMVHTHTFPYVRIMQNKPRVTTKVTIFMKRKINGEPFPFREKDKDPQAGSTIRWGWRIAGTGSRQSNHRQTNFLLSKTTAYCSDNEKTAVHRPKHRAQPQSLKQSWMFTWVTGTRVHRSHRGSV